MEDRFNRVLFEKKSSRLANYRFRCVALGVAIFAAHLFTSQNCFAQKVAVTKFKGNGAQRLSPAGHTSLEGVLLETELEVVSWENYRSAAKKLGLKGGLAREPEGIIALSQELGLSAVVVVRCRFKKKKRRTRCVLNIFNGEGVKLSKNSYSFKGRKTLPPGKLAKMKGDIVASLQEPAGAGVDQVADSGNWSEVAPSENPTGPDTTWAESDGQELNSEDYYSDAEADGDKRPNDNTVGAMSDILLAVGAGLSKREGLDPRHDSGMFFDLRADAHLFIGAFTDIVVLRDIGFGGMFNIDLDLKYGINDEQKQWDSLHLQWRAELIYRLALLNHVVTKPAFIIRGGYGSTIAKIEADDTVGEVKSVSYTGPYAGMDLFLMLYDPVLRFRVGGGMLFAISVGEELKGDASGFYLDAGIDVVIPHWLHMSVGWEMTRFKIDDVQMGEVTDLYNNIYLRVGWSFDSASVGSN